MAKRLTGAGDPPESKVTRRARSAARNQAIRFCGGARCAHRAMLVWLTLLGVALGVLMTAAASAQDDPLSIIPARWLGRTCRCRRVFAKPSRRSRSRTARPAFVYPKSSGGVMVLSVTGDQIALEESIDGYRWQTMGTDGIPARGHGSRHGRHIRRSGTAEENGLVPNEHAPLARGRAKPLTNTPRRRRTIKFVFGGVRIKLIRWQTGLFWVGAYGILYPVVKGVHATR